MVRYMTPQFAFAALCRATVIVTALGATSASIQFKVMPSGLRDCEAGSVATVEWDARSADVKTIKVFVLGDQGETLFTEQGAVGTARTGPWTKPGTQFVLRDGATGTELARLKVQDLGTCK